MAPAAGPPNAPRREVVAVTAGGGITRRGVLRSAVGTATAAVAAGAATGTAAAQTDFGGWFTDSAKGGSTGNYDGTTVDRTGQNQVTISVGADGNGGTFAFDPPAVMVSPGTEVTFEWVSDTHNVMVESTPDGADWSGHESVENSGFSFSHTFETKGIYKYYCQPHLPLGMKGAIVVGPAPGGGGGGGDQGGAPVGSVNANPFWVSLFAGVVALAMLAPMVVSHYRRRGPEDVEYEGPPAGESTEKPAIQEAPVEEPVNELDHDDYDPVGTAALIVVYFLILVGMWVFMYFVEFLGRAVTPMG